MFHSVGEFWFSKEEVRRFLSTWILQRTFIPGKISRQLRLLIIPRDTGQKEHFEGLLKAVRDISGFTKKCGAFIKPSLIEWCVEERTLSEYDLNYGGKEWLHFFLKRSIGTSTSLNWIRYSEEVWKGIHNFYIVSIIDEIQKNNICSQGAGILNKDPFREVIHKLISHQPPYH